MKKWNSPEITALNLGETANGSIDFLVEGQLDVYSFSFCEGFTHETYTFNDSMITGKGQEETQATDQGTNQGS